jgi:hypothetical protein
MADMIITVPDPDVPRVQEAYGSILGKKDVSGNPRPATNAEVQKATTDWIHQSTVDYERRKNTYSYVPPPMNFPP